VAMLNFLKNLREPGNFKTLLFHSSWSLTLTSALSYFFGLVRDRIFAHTFGLSRTLDIYNASFVIPDLLLNVLVGTALSAAFLPIYLKRYDEEPQLGHAYARQMLWWGVTIIVTFGVLVALTLPLYAHLVVPGFNTEELKQYILLTRIMLLSPILFTISNLYGRVIMSFREFLWYGLSPVMYNIGIVLGVIILVPYTGTVGLVLGTVLGILMHLTIRYIIVRKPKYMFSHKPDLKLSPEIRETFKLMLPKMLQYFMWSVLLMSYTGIASELSEGAIAAYNYARNFQSLPVSMLGIAVATAMFTSLSHDAGKGNLQKFKNDFKKDRTRCIVYTILAAGALATLSKPMISILLGGGKFSASDVHLLSTTLQLYCLSVPLESLLHIYHRAYYSLKNTLIPSLFHAFNILLMIILAKISAPIIGVYSIPLSFAFGLALHVIILASIFPFLFRRREAQVSAQ